MSKVNVNIGILGHVDSGKTSLAKALSSVASTACFDKNPQSKERGITLDLGFSCFSVGFPSHLKSGTTNQQYGELQFTLVDCPGHASLIRTIIGGAQIIDMMMLVVDITKGIQTQTAECLVIGEITCGKMLIVLNKIDLVPAEKRLQTIEKMTKKMVATLKATKFHDSAVVAVSADPGNHDFVSSGITELVDVLMRLAFIPKRDSSGCFLFSVDHCFPIKGQGTVMTGTVLQGKISVNDIVEIPMLKITRKVKSIQMFHQSVEEAIQGDRLGVCVTQFDPKLLERGLVCTPGSLPNAYGLIVNVKKVIYFKQAISSKSKYHITLGHETVMAKVRLFQSESEAFDLDVEYRHIEEITEEKKNEAYFALLELDHPVPVVPKGLVIGSKLDTDIHSNTCRIAFSGTSHFVFDNERYFLTVLPRLKVFKMKLKEGIVERMVSPFEVIGKNLLKKETSIQLFINLKVVLSTGEVGVIEGSFGQSGKVKIRVMEGLKQSTQTVLSEMNKKTVLASAGGGKTENVKIMLSFKRYIYDPLKKIIQT